MLKVIGFEEKKFTFDDGRSVEGFYLYLAERRTGVTGTSCERVFVSQTKLEGYVPKLDDEVEVFYNRFGKPQKVVHA